MWPRVKEVAAARKAGIRAFFVPHHQWREGDYETWKYFAPTQENAARTHIFAAGTWGGIFRDEFTPESGEIVAQQHWCSSGFANTDLDLQLKKHGLHKVIVTGLLAHSCIDSTVRFAAELGYEVTLVKDAIASLTWEQMKAAIEITLPNYARHIVATEELLPRLKGQH